MGFSLASLLALEWNFLITPSVPSLKILSPPQLSVALKMVRLSFGVKWGKLVMPITVEPTKPRMCHDERFLNLWIKDCPFSLDCLSDLPWYVGPGHLNKNK